MYLRQVKQVQNLFDYSSISSAKMLKRNYVFFFTKHYVDVVILLEKLMHKIY